MFILGLNYYGVDFSRTKSFAASETGAQFVQAFYRINELVLAEWPKYNPGKYLHKEIFGQDIAVTQALNACIDPTRVPAPLAGYELSGDEVVEMVKAYRIGAASGVGLAILGELLDKQRALGSFLVVFFDVDSREVLSCTRIFGRASGFGLRNYWANALHRALKSWRE